MTDTQQTDNLIAMPAVSARLGGLSRTTVWRPASNAETRGFPQAIRILAGRMAWRASKIEAYIASRQQGASLHHRD